jgi:hypothetical protein
MMLMESYDIRLKRIQYLKQLQDYVSEGKPIIFTDESYIHSSHCLSKCWIYRFKHAFKKPVSKGPRLIMIHAGGKDGFINNGLLIFRWGTLIHITLEVKF